MAAPPRRSRRAAVADLLRNADEPLAASHVAEHLGVHPNTARFHLDALTAEGTVERTTEPQSGPGRPRTLYRHRPGMDRGGLRDYRLLARVLLSRLAAEGAEAGDEAEETGRAWGGFLVDRPAPFQRLTAAESAARLTDLLADLGFAPEPETEADGAPPARVRLRHCPFLELAEEQGPLVCRIHLGLMRGAVAELDAPAAVTGLEPFAEPDACLARLEYARPV